jgi:hypothetical protein
MIDPTYMHLSPLLFLSRTIFALLAAPISGFTHIHPLLVIEQVLMVQSTFIWHISQYSSVILHMMKIRYWLNTL